VYERSLASVIKPTLHSSC